MIMKKQKSYKDQGLSLSLKIENCDIEDLYANEVVEFVAKSHPNDKNPDKDYWYATDVKQKEYE